MIVNEMELTVRGKVVCPVLATAGDPEKAMTSTLVGALVDFGKPIDREALEEMFLREMQPKSKVEKNIK